MVKSITKFFYTLSKDQQDLIINSGDMFCDGEYYYNLPQWFKKTDKKDVFEVMFEKDLPQSIKDKILKLDNPDNNFIPAY